MKHVVRNSRQEGLTLLELMVVLAVIGILATIGATQFQNYISRARTAEGLTLANPYKLAIEERISTGAGTFTLNDLNIPEFVPSQDVTGITVSNSAAAGQGGVITITFGPRVGADNPTITLTPLVSDGAVRWFCSAGGAAPGAGAGGANTAPIAGSLAANRAPASCRG